MALISILLAAALAWAFGALWYGALGTRWMDASGIDETRIDRGNPIPYVVSYICLVLVAVMTRHVLASSGITTSGAALVAGLGLGLFVAAPFVATNIMFSNRSKSLIWMDGAYPVVGTTVIALVLSWFI